MVLSSGSIRISVSCGLAIAKEHAATQGGRANSGPQLALEKDVSWRLDATVFGKHHTGNRETSRLQSFVGGTAVADCPRVKLLSSALVVALAFAFGCTPRQRSSTGVAFAAIGGTLSIAGIQGLEGSSADNKSNDVAVTVLVGGLVSLAIGAILYADAKKSRR